MLVDQLSRLVLHAQPGSRREPRAEGIAATRVLFVGNTMIDTLVRLLPSLAARASIARLGIERGEYLLVTLHRPKLVDGPLLSPTFDALRSAEPSSPVVFPVHPRPCASASSCGTTRACSCSSRSATSTSSRSRRARRP